MSLRAEFPRHHLVCALPYSLTSTFARSGVRSRVRMAMKGCVKYALSFSFSVGLVINNINMKNMLEVSGGRSF